VTVSDPELVGLLGGNTACNAFTMAVGTQSILLGWARAELTHWSRQSRAS